MKNETQINLRDRSPDDLRAIYTDALLASYYHRCDFFDPANCYNRSRSDKSFTEILELCLSERKSLFTIIYRAVDTQDFPHWEFSPGNRNWYINIEVRPELADRIFEKYKLNPKT